jgi:hypothetical protein
MRTIVEDDTVDDNRIAVRSEPIPMYTKIGTAFTDNQVTVFFQFINRFSNQMRAAFEHVGKMMQQFFPVISQAHRAEVKRVHTAYRRKKGKRW